MAPVTLNAIKKDSGKVPVIHGVDIEIADGEFVVLVGPSGCGKSTLLRMIAGLETISAGELSIGGRVVNEMEPKDRDIAMVFQNYALYPHMTVATNMAFSLEHRGGSKAEIAERVNWAAEILGLKPLLDRYPRQLSGGQRQRVALARAIVREPNVFLMDEPLSNLDAKLRVSTRAQIKNLSHELAVTTIYVTHDQIEAMTLADRVVVMEKGIVQQVGSPTEIYDKPANSFVASFIGNPAMNLIHGEMSNGVFKAEHTEISGLSAPDGKTTLGFRAEDAQVVSDGGDINAKIYTQELLGDATMVSVRIGGSLVAVKAEKNYRARIDDPVSFKIPSDVCHLFNSETGARIGE